MKVTVEFETDPESDDLLDYERFLRRNEMAGVIREFGEWMRNEFKHGEPTTERILEQWHETLNYYNLDWVDV